MAARLHVTPGPAEAPPRFFWQGVLILLPVFVLAGAGAWALRQDRQMARHEALESAQQLAQETARQLQERLAQPQASPLIQEEAFRVNANGKLIFPPEFPGPPLPSPLDLNRLTPTQQAAWTALPVASAPTNTNPASVQSVEPFDHFLSLKPPEEFIPLAQLGKGRALAAQRRTLEASNEFRALLTQYPEARLESGLPLGPIVEWEIVQLPFSVITKNSTNSLVVLSNFCFGLVQRPSFLTPPLLQQALELEDAVRRGVQRSGFEHFFPPNAVLVASWQREWLRHELLRQLAHDALEQTLPRFSASSRSTNQTRAPGQLDNGGLRLNSASFLWLHAEDVAPFPHPKGPSITHLPKNNRAAAEVALSGGGAPPFPALAFDPSTRHPREHAWLACRVTGSDPIGSSTFLCRQLGWWQDNTVALSTTASEALALRLPSVQRWFDCLYLVRGVPLFKSKFMGTLKPFASTVVADGPNESLRVDVYFSRPELFYRTQDQRTLTFGGLIALATLAGVVGFVAARRAFYRQQQLNVLKSNFVASVSHELRAPIASVRLMAENLESGTVTEPARRQDYFRFIVQECRRLSGLIENVLNFARIEQGRKQYDFEPTDLAALLRQTLQILEPAAAQKQLKLQLQIPEAQLASLPSPPSLDGAAVQQALVNLLDNAIKHSRPGQSILLGAELEEPPSLASASAHAAAAAPPGSARSLRLFVEDHGAGIPSEEHQRIFERFYRRGSELRRQTQGVGIGLSIVKHIAEAHGGRVRVESEVGHGSRFILEIPLQLPPP